jgi:hypothetical protein
MARLRPSRGFREVPGEDHLARIKKTTPSKIAAIVREIFRQ